MVRVETTWLDAELIALSEYELRNFIVCFLKNSKEFFRRHKKFVWTKRTDYDVRTQFLFRFCLFKGSLDEQKP